MRFLTALFLLLASTLHADTTPLTRAIRLENFEEAKKHITPELVNKRDDGSYHPLTYAVYTGNKELVEALLKAGANPNTVEHNGKTALHVAANLAYTEIIVILHQHGALLPTSKNSLAVAQAAIFSSSAETLKTLIRKYPNIDLNKGWRDHNKFYKGWFGCAINYSTYNGYGDVALVLLKHGAEVINPLRGNQGALHFAANSKRCSVEVVNALLLVKLDPFKGIINNSHFQILTPLEFAAARGSLDKVQAMLKGRDINFHKKAISRAALIASAYNNTKVTSHLLQIIGQQKLNSTQWLIENTAAVSDELSNPGHTPIRVSELESLMPRARFKNQKITPNTVAIIATKTLQNSSFLLADLLSKNSNITLLERNAINNVIQENSINSLLSNSSENLHRNLDLIPAEHVIILSNKQVSLGAFTEITLIAVKSGIVSARYAIPTNLLSKASEIKSIAQQLIYAIDRHATLRQQATAFSITPIKPETLSAQSIELARLTNHSLPHHILSTPKCLYLTRKQLKHLEIEKIIGNPSGYWSAAWVIEGSLRIDADNQITVTLQANNTTDSRKVKSAKSGEPKDIALVISQAWQELAKKLHLTPAKNQQLNLTHETQLLAKHAKWLLDANYHEEALSLINANMMLATPNKDTLRIALLANLETLPVSLYKSCKHIRARPQDLEASRKFTLAQHIIEYIDLADVAISYAGTVDRFIKATETTLPHGNVSGSTRKSFAYNEHLSKTLEELHFFRIMMEDSLIIKEHRENLSLLDLKIVALTKAYITKIPKPYTYVRSYTFYRLLKSDYNFYSLHNKELLSTMLNLVADLWLSKKIKTVADYAELYIQRVHDHHNFGISIKEWIEFGNRIEQREAPNLRVALTTGSFYLASIREDRIKALQKLLPATIEIGSMSYLPRYKILGSPQVSDLLAAEFPFDPIRIKRIKLTDFVPPGGLQEYFWNSVNKVVHTKDFQRAHNLYASLVNLKYQKSNYWISMINSYAKAESSLEDHHKISAMDWAILREIAANMYHPSPQVLSLMDKIRPPHGSRADDKKMAEAHIDLTPFTILPVFSENPNLVQLARITEATIQGDNLWIPATYYEARSRYPDEGLCRSVIHIINLATKKIRTVVFPTDSPVDFPGQPRNSLTGSINTSPKVIMGDNYAYYIMGLWNRASTPSRLFSIHLETLQIKEIKLPLPAVISSSEHAVGDSLILSLANSRQVTLRKVNIVIQVSGDQIVKTLVSTRRKPSKSPLDDPKNMINRIHQTANNIWLFSNLSFYKNSPPGRIDGARYSKKNQSWSDFSKVEYTQKKSKHTAFLTDFNIGTKSVSLSDQEYYLTISRAGMGQYIPYIATASHEKYARSWNPAGITHPNKSPYFNIFRTNIAPINHAQFNTEYCLSAGTNLRSTVNSSLKKGEYQNYVIGKWNGLYLVGTHIRNAGFPAIWSMKEADLKLYLANAITRNPPPLSFEHIPMGELLEMTSPAAKLTANKGHAIIASHWMNHEEKSLHIQAGRDRNITITATGPLKNGFTSLTLNSFRGFSKPQSMPFKFRILIERDGQWEEVYNGDTTVNKYYVTPLHLKFPQKTPRIRISCDSHPKRGGVNIDELILR